MNAQPHITYNDNHLRIDGIPALIQAGVLHYFRLPHPDLWSPVLHRMRAGGLNAVVVPFPWAYHSPAPSLYDFTGPRDAGYLLNAIEQAGLWLIPDVGPWIDTGGRAGLNAGGLPTWFLNTPNVCPNCESAVPAGPSFAFVRYVKEWWSQLFTHFTRRPNLLMVALNPGWCANEQGLPRYTRALTGLARDLGVSVPFIVPHVHIPTAFDAATTLGEIAIIPRYHLEIEQTVNHIAAGFPVVETGPALVLNSGPRERMAQEPGKRHPHLTISRLVNRGATAYALSPVHSGLNWGYWGTSTACAATGTGAPLGEGAELTPAYFDMHSTTSTAETLSAALLATSPRQTDERETNLLPVNWHLAGGQLLTTTLAPILHTAVAGRHLLVLTNDNGGDLLLSADFRPQHARGPVRAQRTDKGLAIRFEAARWISLLLDGPEGPLQLLALNPHYAARVWPLDDSWRTTPAYPAAWQPAPEDPARGLLIGPELVQPRADGGYDFLVTQKGFGYRWGPWRGSDPRTWLAPITWRDPPKIELPALTWETRYGAPELLPEYEDQSWPATHIGTSPTSGQSQSADGFTWYRGHFEGTATAVTVHCDQAFDIFLNGMHIAALSPSAQTTPSSPKTIPLPVNLLQTQNVLSLLVEDVGHQHHWDREHAPRGLVAVSLDSGASIYWRMRRGLTGEHTVQGFPGYADWGLVPGDGTSHDGTPHITWHRAAFPLNVPDDVEVPLFLYLDHTPKRAYIFVNGQLVGRYWDDRGSQHRFWLPEGILQRQEENELLIAQWTRGAQPGIGMARLEHGTVKRWYRS